MTQTIALKKPARKPNSTLQLGAEPGLLGALRARCDALDLHWPVPVHGGDAEDEAILHDLLRRIIGDAALSARERDVLNRRFAFDEAPGQIAGRWRVGRTCIRRTETRALDKLRHAALRLLPIAPMQSLGPQNASLVEKRATKLDARARASDRTEHRFSTTSGPVNQSSVRPTCYKEEVRS